MNRLKQFFLRLAFKLIRPSIIFESKPDYTDNTMAVFKEMARRGFWKKYRMLWNTEDGGYSEFHGDRFVKVDPYRRKSIQDWVLNLSFCRTKMIIYSNVYPSAFDHPPTRFYLSHGTPIKSIRGYYKEGSFADYCLAASENVADLDAYEFNVDRVKIRPLGFPRNDAFSQPPKDALSLFSCEAKKLVVWYPTYRQRKDGLVCGGIQGVPLLYDENNARELNDFAQELGILIVIKLHFVQKPEHILDLKLNNIHIIQDDFFEENKILPYEFLASSDALITDYSSVYYDYTLRDKPIAVVWEDLEEYKKFPGFAVDLDFFLKGAEKIHSLEELKGFLREVHEEKDRLQEERRAVRDFVNCSVDGYNTQRVVDFIESLLSE